MWIGTGAAAKARIIATTDGGEPWQPFETPVVQGTPSSGILTVAFRDARHGILGAGELAAPDRSPTTSPARATAGGHGGSAATPPSPARPSGSLTPPAPPPAALGATMTAAAAATASRRPPWSPGPAAPP